MAGTTWRISQSLYHPGRGGGVLEEAVLSALAEEGVQLGGPLKSVKITRASRLDLCVRTGEHHLPQPTPRVLE